MSVRLARRRVRRLAAEAKLAADRERAYRGGLLASGRRILTGGKLVIIGGLAGFVLLALRKRPGRRAERADGDQSDGGGSPGLLTRAIMFGLALLRWRNLAGDVVELFGPPPTVTEPTGPTGDV